MLPPGPRFKPTDQELITDYLYNKVLAKEPLMASQDDVVPECNFLAKTEPWVIWDQLVGPNPSELDQDVYFFTQLELLIADQVESGGNWRQTATEGVEDHEGNIIGLKRCLLYENVGYEHDGKWILEEYSVPECSKIVLCRLKRTSSPLRSCGKRKHSEDYFELINEHEQRSNKAARTEFGSSSATPQRPNLDDHVIVIDDDDDEEEEVGLQSSDQHGLDEWFFSQNWSFTTSPVLGGIGDDVEALQKWSDDLVPFMLEDEQHNLNKAARTESGLSSAATPQSLLNLGDDVIVIDDDEESQSPDLFDCMFGGGIDDKAEPALEKWWDDAALSETELLCPAPADNYLMDFFQPSSYCLESNSTPQNPNLDDHVVVIDDDDDDEESQSLQSGLNYSSPLQSRPPCTISACQNPAK